MIELSDIRKFLREKVSYNKREDVLYIEKNSIELKGKNVHIISFGKASISMAQYFVGIMKEKIVGGIIVYPKNYEVKIEVNSKLEQIKAGHPYPDEDSIRAGNRIIKYLENLGEEDIVIFLISGGGSALVEKPIEGISLGDLQITTKLLLNSGATIKEINIIRKHLSAVKGGRLAEKAFPAKSISLLVSDVPGDNPEDIASGPTVPDPSTYKDALEIAKFYDIWESLPETVKKVIEKGIRNELPETPKEHAPYFKKSIVKTIATPLEFIKKLEKHVRGIGYRPITLTSQLRGESKEAAKMLASIAIESWEGKNSFEPPIAIIATGETSVTVRGNGVGGRALELTIYFAKEISGKGRISLLAMDTDGIDGNSPAAGGFADQTTWEKILGIYGHRALIELKNNNTYPLLESISHTIRTGATGTNLNNIVIVFVDKREDILPTI